jgi:hypothetical protein
MVKAGIDFYSLFKNSIFLNKFIACLVFFCIITTSTNIVNNIPESITIEDTIQTSAQTILVHFFYISALPANFISKLFLSKQADPISNKKQSEEQNKSKSESNSAKASLGYSILPVQTNLTKSLEQKNLKGNISLPLFAKFLKQAKICFKNDFGLLGSINAKFNSDIIMMLLLAISLTRRDIGDGNIITINIKNNKTAQLI